MQGTRPSYIVTEIEANLFKEVWSLLTDEEFNALPAKEQKEKEDASNALKASIRKARIDKDKNLIGSLERELEVLNGTKRRNLRRFEVVFPRKHSNTFDEISMMEQRLFMKAPEFNAEANEIVPDSYPEGYIGLAEDEFVVSFVPEPKFKKAR